MAKIIPQNKQVKKYAETWKTIQILYEMDKEKYRNFIHKLPREDDVTYEKRNKQYPREFVNLCPDLVQAPVDKIYSEGVKNFVRDKETTNKQFETDMLKKFNNNVSRGESNPISLNEYAHDYIAPTLRSYGTPISFINKPSGNNQDRESELMAGMPYLTSINVLQVADWQFADDGDLLWFAFNTTEQDPWLDLTQDKPPVKDVQVLLTRDQIIVTEKDDETKERRTDHKWGVVPIVWQPSYTVSESNFFGMSAMWESVDYIITGNNFQSAGNWDLYKHGGAELMLPDNVTTARNQKTDHLGRTIKKNHEPGMPVGDTKNEGDFPKYLTKELETEGFNEKTRYYFKMAVENERDQKGMVKKGTDGTDIQESGIAKAIDQSSLEGNLTTLARDVEEMVKKITDMVTKILKISENTIVYQFPEKFNVLTESQTLDNIKKARDNNEHIETPLVYKERLKEYHKNRSKDPEVQEAINQEIDNMDLEPEIPPLNNFGQEGEDGE